MLSLAKAQAVKKPKRVLAAKARAGRHPDQLASDTRHA